MIAGVIRGDAVLQAPAGLRFVKLAAFGVCVLIFIALLMVVAANAQSTRKSAPHDSPPASAQMSHDFRTAGRRALTAISDLAQSCTLEACSSVDVRLRFLEKAGKAIEEADAQHDNAIDRQALQLLKLYNTAAYVVVTDRGASRSNLPHVSFCQQGACEAMYLTCKKEAEEAFETGLLSEKLECKAP